MMWQELLAFLARVNTTDVTCAVVIGPALKMVGTDMSGSLNPCGYCFFHSYMGFFSLNDSNSDRLLIKSTAVKSWSHYHKVLL